MDRYIVKLKVKQPDNLYFIAQAINGGAIEKILKQVLTMYGKTLPVLKDVTEIESIELWGEKNTKVFIGTADFDAYIVAPKWYKHVPLKQVKGLKSAYTSVCRQINSNSKAMFIGYKSDVVVKPKIEQSEAFKKKTLPTKELGVYELPASFKPISGNKAEPKAEPKVEPKAEPKADTKVEKKPKPDLYSRIGLTESALKKLYEALKAKLTEYYRVNCIVDKVDEKEFGYFYGVILFDNIVSKSIGVHYGITDNSVKPWVLLPWVDILNSGTFNVISPVKVKGATEQDANRWADKHPLVFKDFETVKKELFEAFEKEVVL